MVLGRDVMVGRPDGVPLLRAGAMMTPRYRDLLVRAGVSAVYIHDKLSEGISVETAIDDRSRAIATRAVATAYNTARQVLGRDELLGADSVGFLEDVVKLLMDQIESIEGMAVVLADLCTADAYTFQHSIDVAAIGLLVGHRYFRDYGWVDYQGQRRFDSLDERLSTLGLGLLLHDIGKLTVPLAILNKAGKLTSEEWEIMRSHPRAGVDMLAGQQWSPLVKAVILRHHERWDGSGYPDGKAGHEIHQMARIAAVADVFDAVTSERPYAAARPSCEGVRAIVAGSGTLFDPEVVEAFERVVAPFPAGSPVELTDGRKGIVVSVQSEAMDRPLVRIVENGVAVDEVALQEEPDLGIAGWHDAAAPAVTLAA